MVLSAMSILDEFEEYIELYGKRFLDLFLGVSVYFTIAMFQIVAVRHIYFSAQNVTI